MKSILAASAAIFLLGAAAAHAQSLEAEKIVICKKKGGCPGNGNGNGLAVGQNPKLLAITRAANAGIGNGPEGSKSEATDFDPGNSGAHNQAADDDPGCGILKECLEL